jgi:hypothetical protein
VGRGVSEKACEWFDRQLALFGLDGKEMFTV